MIQRIITAVVFVAVLLPFLIFSHTAAFTVFVSVLTVSGVYEMLKTLGFNKNLYVCIPSYTLAAVTPFLARIISKNSSVNSFLSIFVAMVFIFMFYIMNVSLLSKNKIKIQDMSEVFMTVVYIIIGFSSTIILRDMSSGQYTFWLIFVCAWITDTFAYFTGRFFGKHKLIPEISPKKTIEGSIGGIVFCILFFNIYGLVIGKFFDVSQNHIALTVIALITSIISQLGDLVASLIKRQKGVKDYGNLLPGHGGVLDRFDSVLAVAPFFVILCSVFDAFKPLL